MDKLLVKEVEKGLNLERKIVGIKFLVYKQEYDKSIAKPFKGRMRLCGFVNKSNYGEHIKVKVDNFACPGGPHQLGLMPQSEIDLSGQGLYHCGLYSDLSISREVSESFMRIPQKIYGLEIGPLDNIDNADIVIILGWAEQIMKIVKGYVYHYGVPNSFITVGNAAMCSDLVAKPFMKNDINLSLMCCGARTSTKSNHGELGVGMPLHIFKEVAIGVLKTINN